MSGWRTETARVPTNHAIGENQITAEESRLEIAAALLVCLLFLVAALFPENFITSLSFVSAKTAPLALLLPLTVFFTTFYMSVRRRLISSISLGALDLIVIVFTFYLLIRNIAEPTYLYAIRYALYGICIYYLMALISVREGRGLRLIGRAILAVILITAVYGLIEYLLQTNPIYQDYISQIVKEPRVTLHRIGSTVGHPVPYGAFLIQAIPFAVLAWVQARSKLSLAVAASATLIGAIALFLTYSKGSWIVAVLLALGSLILLRGHGRSHKKMVLPAVFIAIVLLATGVLFWQQIRFETEERAEGSVDLRLAGWRGAIDGIHDNPFVGVGFKQGEDELARRMDPVLYEWTGKTPPVDNYFLSIALENGIIALIMWLLLLALILFEAIRVIRAGGAGRPWAIAALISFLGIVMNSMTYESMLIWPNFVFFWIIAGMLHGLAWRSKVGLVNQNGTDC